MNFLSHFYRSHAVSKLAYQHPHEAAPQGPEAQGEKPQGKAEGPQNAQEARNTARENVRKAVIQMPPIEVKGRLPKSVINMPAIEVRGQLPKTAKAQPPSSLMPDLREPKPVDLTKALKQTFGDEAESVQLYTELKAKYSSEVAQRTLQLMDDGLSQQKALKMARREVRENERLTQRGGTQKRREPPAQIARND